jgi:5'-3' exonuclease
MGVPSYFRWLSDRYPYVLDDVLEGDQYKRTGRCHVGSPVPAPTTETDADGHEPAALPQGMPTVTPEGKTVQVFQVDNLYLDCNGEKMKA